MILYIIFLTIFYVYLVHKYSMVMQCNFLFHKHAGLCLRPVQRTVVLIFPIPKLSIEYLLYYTSLFLNRSFIIIILNNFHQTILYVHNILFIKSYNTHCSLHYPPNFIYMLKKTHFSKNMFLV